MKHLRFTKMHGLGNDFIVLDGLNQTIQLTPQCIATLANRHTGIGFDQCLIIEPSNEPDIDFNYRIFNADGQEVGQCGNGARCLALFAKHYGLTTKTHLKIATNTTQMHLRINKDDSVSVDFGVPNLSPNAIPFIADHESQDYLLELEENKITSIHALSVGNPHAVLLVSDCKSAPVDTLGKQISTHARFPEQTNTGFMQIMSPNHIMLRVYERGCGETLACGSGAVAAAAIGRLYYGLSNQITVTLPGGDLVVDWADFNGPITLTGPGVLVYEGTMLL
jgi:diaminopimelate epimerase